MTTASENLIASVHPALSIDAEAESVIGLSPTADTWLAIDDGALIVVLDENSAMSSFTLADYSMAGLVASLPLQLGASLLSADWTNVQSFALQPREGRTYAADAAPGSLQLTAYTAGIWRIMRPLGVGLALLGGDVDRLLRQSDVFQSDEHWLDLWGLLYNIPRLPSEADSVYRTRIVYTLTMPRANNRALELLIKQALGRVAYVEDGGIGGLFTMNGTGVVGPGGAGVWGPQSYGQFLVTLQTDGSEDTAPLIALINSYKAAGTTYTLNTLYTPTAFVTFANVQATWE